MFRCWTKNLIIIYIASHYQWISWCHYIKTLSILLTFCAVICDALMFMWNHFNVCVQCAGLEIDLFSCDQATLRTLISVCPSIRFTMFLSSLHHEIFWSYWQWQKWHPCNWSRSEVKGQGHKRSKPHLAVSGPLLQVECTYGNEMMHKAWCCLEKVP